MVNVIARLKKSGKNFEILVDLDRALSFKKSGQGNMQNILAINEIFFDSKKGLRASSSSLASVFGNTNVEEIAACIIKEGEIQLTEEYRKKEREARMKQLVDWLSRNCVDPRTNLPYSNEIIKRVIEDAGISIEEKPLEEQLPNILKKIREKLPIKMQTKKIEIKVPAAYTAKVYSLLHQYKEKEEWLPDGSLICIVILPSGMQSEFYNKLNSATHGSAETKMLEE